MKGGLFQMRRASKSWRSALQSFVLRPRFGRMECMSGRQITCGAGPPMQIRRKNRSGEHLTSWFAHAMRCSCGTSNSFAFLDFNCLLAGRSDACGVCVCVWNYRRFASLDLTAFWRGVRCTEGDDIYRHKVVMDITFAAWCEVNIEFAERLFCVKLWMLGFAFDMSERMSEDMSERVSKDLSERMSKDMSERCQKECQKIRQKECQKIYQKNISEDMSERMSKDMSERTSEDCFSQSAKWE